MSIVKDPAIPVRDLGQKDSELRSDWSMKDPELTNEDLIPVSPEDRKWTWWSFSALWMGISHNLFNFTWIGGLMLMGMTAIQAFAITMTGNIIQTLLIGMTGRVGARHGIPFPVWARSTFGVYGANIPSLIRGITAIIWFGIQSFLGSTAVNLVIGAAWTPWRELNHIIFGVSLNLWIAMIIYWSLNILVIRRGMDTVRRFENWAGPLILIVMIPLVIWAFTVMHGLGPVFETPSKYSSASNFLLTGFFPAVILYISGSYATMVLNISDITRYARSNRGQFWGTMIGMPLATFAFFAMVTIIVSGTLSAFGEALWNPADVLLAINNPMVSILGGIALGIASIAANIPSNIISPAYDLTNLFPKFFTFRRGALVSIVLSFIYMPWVLMESPENLYSVLGYFGAVLGPITGIMIADYFLIRKQRLEIHELYKVHGRYRAYKGFNLVSLGVFFIVGISIVSTSFIPTLEWIYEYAWFIGLVTGFGVYLIAVQVVKRISGELPKEFEAKGSYGVEYAELIKAEDKIV